MNKQELYAAWKAEEDRAHIHGWDFSHIEDRYEQEPLPWDYETVLRQYLRQDARILDYDTGGGEFLRKLGHPYANTAATEGYPPNVQLIIRFSTPDARKALICSRIRSNTGRYGIGLHSQVTLICTLAQTRCPRDLA